jgi:hypothetical protein
MASGSKRASRVAKRRFITTDVLSIPDSTAEPEHSDADLTGTDTITLEAIL